MINNEFVIENLTRQLSAGLKRNDWNQMFLKADPTKSIWFWLQDTVLENQGFLHGYIGTNDYVVSADPSLNVSGKWRNSYRGITQTFSQSGNNVTGTDSNGVRITGTLSGNTLDARWTHPNGTIGRLQYIFASDGNSYTGKSFEGDAAEPNIISTGKRIS